MPKSIFEKAITEAANVFALQVVEAVKYASLQELVDIQDSELSTKSRRALETKGASKSSAASVKKKRNYPKCAYPGCEKNRFPRGKGFCGEHWRQFKAREIKAAGEYGQTK